MSPPRNELLAHRQEKPVGPFASWGDGSQDLRGVRHGHPGRHGPGAHPDSRADITGGSLLARQRADPLHQRDWRNLECGGGRRDRRRLHPRCRHRQHVGQSDPGTVLVVFGHHPGRSDLFDQCLDSDRCRRQRRVHLEPSHHRQRGGGWRLAGGGSRGCQSSGRLDRHQGLHRLRPGQWLRQDRSLRLVELLLRRLRVGNLGASARGFGHLHRRRRSGGHRLGDGQRPGRRRCPRLPGITNAGLLGWSASVQETFGSWPASYQALAVDNSATPSDFTGPDGLSGRPYVLVNNAPTPSSFAGAVQGAIPTSATYGATDDASPGVSQGITTAGSGVNPANGDFTSQSTDASAATYGPALSLSRTYDSKLAQAESTTGTPGAFGYGWSSNYGTYLSLHSATPNDIYTAKSSGLSHPQNETMDSAGNLYIADTGNNRVEEVAASSHTQWGIAMTAGTKYVIAGSSSGTAGSSGSGGAATSALLSAPTDVAVDANGDLYIADSVNDRIQEVAASTGTQWGTSMTANDIYSVLGTTGTSGCSGNAHVASTAVINTPTGIAVDGSGNLYVADEANNRVLELPKATGTYWGISITGGSIYTVVGHSTCTSGISGDGAVATGAHLASPYGVSLDAAGDLLVADSGNQRIQEVPVASGTQWGIAMTAAFMYTIAGNASGSTGHSGDGGVATSALLNNPTGTAVDSVGDLYITDSSNNRIQEVAQTTRTQWGTAMTANDIYTVAGSSTGTSGSNGDGGAATAALLASPRGSPSIPRATSMWATPPTAPSVRWSPLRRPHGRLAHPVGHHRQPGEWGPGHLHPAGERGLPLALHRARDDRHLLCCALRDRHAFLQLGHQHLHPHRSPLCRVHLQLHRPADR